MADLTGGEKRKLEQLFGMGSGYVLNFSNRTFSEFVEGSTGRDIYDSQYDNASGSKANRLRAFWVVENNHLVGKLIGDLIDYGQECDAFKNDGALQEECRKIITRLQHASPVPELDALSATGDERDFETVAKQVREVIEKNQPEAGLDRLHTSSLSLCARCARSVGSRSLVRRRSTVCLGSMSSVCGPTAISSQR